MSRGKSKIPPQSDAEKPAWPKLGFLIVAELDYEIPEYDAKWLREMSALMHGPRAGYVTSAHWAVGECLQRLAEIPEAIELLNHSLPRAPQELRALNVAVHYLALLEMSRDERSKEVRHAVAEAWSISDATVKDYAHDHRIAAPKLLDRFVRRVNEQPERAGYTRRQILELIDSDMRHRSHFSWATTRKKKSSTPSRRK